MAAVAAAAPTAAATPTPEAALATCVDAWPSRSTRLPRMLDRIVAEPYDTEAWTFVLQETAQQPQPEHFRPVFGRFLALFPTSASGWRQYIEAELRVGQLNAAENLFATCLIECPELELWRCYLRFVQNNKQASRVEVLQAHELLLGAVGADIDAGPSWSEYIALLCEDAEDHSAQSGQVQQHAGGGARRPPRLGTAACLQRSATRFGPPSTAGGQASLSGWDTAAASQGRHLAPSTTRCRRCVRCTTRPCRSRLPGWRCCTRSMRPGRTASTRSLSAPARAPARAAARAPAPARARAQLSPHLPP